MKNMTQYIKQAKKKKEKRFTMTFEYFVLINGIQNFEETNVSCFNQFNSYFKQFKYTIYKGMGHLYFVMLCLSK